MRKFIISGLAILLAMGLMGGAFALFSDTESSPVNAFSAGTLNLQVKDDGLLDPDLWGEGVDLTWVMSNMKPGVGSALNTVDLRNVGTIAGDHVEIAFSHSIDEVTNPVGSDTKPDSQPGDLAKWLEITIMLYDGLDLLENIQGTPGWDDNGNGWLDLDDVASSPAIIVAGGPLDNLPSPDVFPGGTVAFMMKVKFRVEATNDIQGDILTTIVTFILNQKSSQ